MRRLAGLLSVGALMMAATGSLAHAETGSVKEALVYRDDNGQAGCPPSGSIPGCAEAAKLMVERSGYRVTYVGPQGEDLRAALARKPALYVQPGGGDSLEGAWREMKPYAADIRRYVRDGGHYLGICMGGYLAGTATDSGTGGFQLLAEDAGQYTALPGATVTDDLADTSIEVRWRNENRRIFYQGGPYFLEPSGESTVLARYRMTDEWPGDRKAPIAAMVAPYGQGRIAVSGPHPEAPKGWWQHSNRPGDMPADLNVGLGRDLIDTLSRG